MVNYFLYRIGQFIALALPRKAVYKIAPLVSDLNYQVSFIDRWTVKRNLKVIFPRKKNAEICRIRLAMFRNFSKHIVDFFRFSKIDEDFIKKNIKIENRHYLDEALAKGKGVITLTAHLGSWELGGAVMGVLGYPFWAVALPHKHKEVDDFFNGQRQNKGVNVIPLGKAGRKCLQVLRENQVLGLVGDRDFQESGYILNFFGKPTIFPGGPAAFALKTGAAIIPGFMLRNKDDTFTFKFEKPIEFTPTADKENDIRGLIGKYILTFEDYIRKYPDQWYMFRRFWVE